MLQYSVFRQSELVEKTHKLLNNTPKKDSPHGSIEPSSGFTLWVNGEERKGTEFDTAHLLVFVRAIGSTKIGYSIGTRFKKGSFL